MTFKHTKFDSPTFRALEKVAVEKGLVKPESLQKKAAVTKKADYTPTPNLMENVFKLCAGLRTVGLEKEANEIEMNYLNYKRAQTLYETSKEKGEDLVDAAHPKGSHKLEGVDGEEATIENIIDQQLKDLKVVEKKPTGKLSNAKSILSAVRVVLAQDKETIMGQLREQMRILVSAITTLDAKTSSELTAPLSGFFGQGYLSTIQQLASNPTIDNIKKLQGVLSKMRFRLKPGLAMGLSEDKWSQVSPFVDKADAALAKALDLRTQYNQTINTENQQDTPQGGGESGEGGGGGRVGVTTVMNAEGKQFMNQVNTWLGQLKSWAVTVNNDPENTDADKQQANEWINNRTSELTSLRDKFMGEQDPNEQNQKASGYLAALGKSRFARESAQFQRSWVG